MCFLCHLGLQGQQTIWLWLENHLLEGPNETSEELMCQHQCAHAFRRLALISFCQTLALHPVQSQKPWEHLWPPASTGKAEDPLFHHDWFFSMETEEMGLSEQDV